LNKFLRKSRVENRLKTLHTSKHRTDERKRQVGEGSGRTFFSGFTFFCFLGFLLSECVLQSAGDSLKPTDFMEILNEVVKLSEFNLILINLKFSFVLIIFMYGHTIVDKIII
jgi:hypothetical protein